MKQKKNTKTYGFSLPEPMAERVKHYCKCSDIFMSEFVREAIEEKFEKLDDLSWGDFIFNPNTKSKKPSFADIEFGKDSVF